MTVDALRFQLVHAIATGTWLMRLATVVVAVPQMLMAMASAMTETAVSVRQMFVGFAMGLEPFMHVAASEYPKVTATVRAGWMPMMMGYVTK